MRLAEKWEGHDGRSGRTARSTGRGGRGEPRPNARPRAPAERGRRCSATPGRKHLEEQIERGDQRSASWRLTAPLRALAPGLQGPRGGAARPSRLERSARRAVGSARRAPASTCSRQEPAAPRWRSAMSRSPSAKALESSSGPQELLLARRSAPATSLQLGGLAEPHGEAGHTVWPPAARDRVAVPGTDDRATASAQGASVFQRTPKPKKAGTTARRRSSRSRDEVLEGGEHAVAAARPPASPPTRNGCRRPRRPAPPGRGRRRGPAAGGAPRGSGRARSRCPAGRAAS